MLAAITDATTILIMSLEITHNPIATNQTDRYVTVNAVFFPRPPRVGEADVGNLICTMSSRRDLTTATRLRPKLYRQYVALGRKLQFTLQFGRTLEETTGIPISGNARQALKPWFEPVGISQVDRSANTHPS